MVAKMKEVSTEDVQEDDQPAWTVNKQWAWAVSAVRVSSVGSEDQYWAVKMSNANSEGKQCQQRRWAVSAVNVSSASSEGEQSAVRVNNVSSGGEQC